jgi:hypothetical protein
MNPLYAFSPETIAAELEYRRRILAVGPRRRTRRARRSVR